jgi:integrase
LPTVLTRSEVQAVLARMDGVYGLMARLLYGTGMRLMECVRLRVKDVDFERREILIRDGKGAKDRVTVLPESLRVALQAHLAERRKLYEQDSAEGKSEVYLPDALARKYPQSPKEWGWQYVFPSGSYSSDPRSGRERRHHVDEKLIAAGHEKSRPGCQHRQAGDAAHVAA